MFKLIHVLGPARSGTTITHLMLGNGEGAFACGEIHAYCRPWRRHHFELKCRCPESIECVWKGLDRRSEKNIHKQVALKTESQWIVDESKDLVWFLDSLRWAKEEKFDVINVLMFKDPIDLAYSEYKRGSALERSVRKYLNYYQRFLSLKCPFVSVNINDLQNHPEEIIKRLCEVLGVAYWRGKELYWNNKSCHLFGSNSVFAKKDGESVAIRPAQQVPIWFQDMAQEELNKLKSRKEYDDIIALIRENDVKEVGHVDYARWDHVKKIKPVWFYQEVVKSFIKRCAGKFGLQIG